MIFSLVSINFLPECNFYEKTTGKYSHIVKFQIVQGEETDGENSDDHSIS